MCPALVTADPASNFMYVDGFNWSEVYLQFFAEMIETSVERVPQPSTFANAVRDRFCRPDSGKLANTAACVDPSARVAAVPGSG